jgi:hypothetical protein
MPLGLRGGITVYLRSLCLLGLALALGTPLRAEEVWSGLTYSFSHPVASDLTDQITPNVAINRGTTFGIYNAAYEGGYTNNLSPEWTKWATVFNNPEDTSIELDNRANLVFTDWQTAYGSAGALASNITAATAIVFLELDDIYLELQFQTWGVGMGGGGEFSYLRSAPPATLPTGDYNGDFKVDAADYTVWRDTLGSTTDLRANGDNTGPSENLIDLADYAFWKARFGNDVPMGAASVVPEPASALLLLGGFSIIAFNRKRFSPRGPGQGC